MSEATLKQPKGSVLEEKDKLDGFDVPDYTDAQQTYLRNLQKKLESAKTQRDQVHNDFDGLDYIQHYWANERGANTSLKSKTNKDDPIFQSGTLRTKMMSFLSTFQNLNLSPDITAFNKNEFPISSLGNAIEDIVDKCNEVQNDEEKRMMRQYEMLKHGTVHVEVMWEDKWIIEKTIKESFMGDSKKASWTSKRVKGMGMPVKRIIPNVSVYKGDMSIYLIDEQPFIFTVEMKNYDECEQIYGQWDMWKYIPKTTKRVKVIKYQDKPHNEFQILCYPGPDNDTLIDKWQLIDTNANLGIPMLPMGYPLSEISPEGGYTIVQQNLEPIRETFSEGKSFIFRNKNLVAVLDQMMKMGVLKTYKSLEPPRANLSDRVISRDVFMAGKITRGIRPQDVPVFDEHEAKGITPGEFGMMQEMIKTIDRNTVSQTTTGAKEEGGKVTATQILELKRQANIMIGLSVTSAALLEWKIAHKELALILQKWFEPNDQTVDQARQVLKNKYRSVSRERGIEGKGRGIRMTIPTEEIPSSQAIKEMEAQTEKETGIPVKIIMLNPKELREAKITWGITINPREKKSSEYNKMIFDEMITRVQGLGWPLNPDWGMDRFAETWGEDASKMFLRGEQIIPPNAPQGATNSQSPQGGGMAPKVKIEAPTR